MTGAARRLRVAMRDLPAESHYLRCVRFLPGEAGFREYDAMTFPNNPWEGISTALRRANVMGGLVDDGNGFQIDILDRELNIIADFPCSRRAFEYLRARLKFRLVHSTGK